MQPYWDRRRSGSDSGGNLLVCGHGWLEFLQRCQANGFLLWAVRVQRRRRQDVKGPLVQVQRVERGFVPVVQQAEDINIGLPLRGGPKGSGGGVPSLCRADAETNPGKLGVMPGLQVGRRFDLHLEALLGDQIKGIPLMAHASAKPQRLGHDELRQDAARGVADQIGGRPLPEIEHGKRQHRCPLAEALPASPSPDGHLRKTRLVRVHC